MFFENDSQAFSRFALLRSHFEGKDKEELDTLTFIGLNLPFQKFVCHTSHSFLSPHF